MEKEKQRQKIAEEERAHNEYLASEQKRLFDQAKADDESHRFGNSRTFIENEIN